MSQELFINSTIIPLREDIPVPVTYSIADIREPDKRKSSISKTITIPGSKEVNKLFGHIFEIGIDSTFNPKKKADAVLYVDTVPVLSGALQLIKINRLDKEEIEYECLLISALADIITTWGDTLLEDLDLSEYTHQSNDATIQWNSLDTSIKVNGSDQPFQLGVGYVYPLIDYGGLQSEPYISPPTFHQADLYPAIYVKTYLDKAFTLAGFQYSSTFLTSTTFKSLIIPYQNKGGKRPLRTMVIGGNVELQSNITNTIYHDISFYAVVYNEYATGTSGPDYTEYLIDTIINIPPGSTRSMSLTEISISVTDGCQVYFVFTDKNKNSNDTFRILQNTYIEGTYADDSVIDGSFRAGRSGTPGTYLPSGVNEIMELNNVSTPNYDPDNTWNTSTYIHTVPPRPLQEYAPQNFKIRDFFKALCNMFNLCVMPDKDNPKLLIIEPYNTFFDSSLVKDWSEKWATDMPVVITPLPDLSAKKFTFTYKKDERDFYNQKYYQSWQEYYGQQIEYVDSDFLSNENVNELPFAPSPMIGVGDLVYPSIVNDQPQVPSKKPNNYAGAPHILYYGGKLATATTWTHIGGGTRSYYGYAGHFDHPYTPSLDINFGICNELYYGSGANIGQNYTDNNLYNAYWAKYIDETTDKNSKLIEAYFYLTPLDMLLFDFRGYIFFDQYLCKVNQIIDYNATSRGLTKVELLTTKYGVPFVPSTTKNIRFIPHPLDFPPVSIQHEIKNVDLLNLHNTPIEIIPSPGAGNVIQVIGVTGQMNNSTIPYTTNTTLAFAFTGDTGNSLYEDANIMTASDGGISSACPSCSGGNTLHANTGVSAIIKNGNPESGDGDLKINILYRVIKVN